MDLKPGVKTSSFIALIVGVAGMAVQILPAVIEKIPPTSSAAIILGIALLVATYIVRRTSVEKVSIQAQAIQASADGAKAATPRVP